MDTEQPTQNPTPTGKRSLMMGFGFVPQLFRASFWRLLFASMYAFRKPLLKPAIMLSVGLTLPYIGLDLAYRFIALQQKVEFHGVGDILIRFGAPIIGLLIVSIGSVVGVVWGLAASLMALTALCRTFLSVAPDSAPKDKNELTTLLEQSRDSALTAFKTRKSYLVMVWLMYSIIMIVPTVIMFGSGAVVMLGMPQMGEYTMLAVQQNLPAPMFFGAAIALGISLLIMSNYALILLPYSAMTEKRSTQAAVGGLVLSLKTVIGLTFYSSIAFSLTSFLCSPVDILVVLNQSLANNDFVRYLLFSAKLIWHVIFFAVLLPLTVLIPCEIIRDNID